MLRIVAGEFGGRRIGVPSGSATRPTSERVREALFSMIGPIDGERVLDLFSGSGALGIESVSRGADLAVFVDKGRGQVRCIESNLDSLGIEALVLQVDWRRALASLRGEGRTFGVVFVDPPYSESDAVFGSLADELDGLLEEGSLIACESATDAASVPGLRLRRERRHGDTLLRLYGND